MSPIQKDVRMAPDGASDQDVQGSIQDILGSWTGRRRGVPLRLTSVQEGQQRAATIRNIDPNGGHFQVVHSNGSTILFDITDDGVLIGSATVGDLKPSYQIADHGRWLKCDGRAMAIADYPELSALIRPIHGGPDATRFFLPDLRGYVLAGQGGVLGGALGSKQGLTAFAGTASISNWSGASFVGNSFSSFVAQINNWAGVTVTITTWASFVATINSWAAAVVNKLTAWNTDSVTPTQVTIQSGGGETVLDNVSHEHPITDRDRSISGSATGSGSGSASGGISGAANGTGSGSIGVQASGTATGSCAGSTIQPTALAHLFIHA